MPREDELPDHGELIWRAVTSAYFAVTGTILPCLHVTRM